MLFDTFVPNFGDEPRFTEFTGKRGRTLHRPNQTMAILQENLQVYLRSLLVPMPYAHGGVRGRSVVSNARPHINNRYFFQTDLADAYGSLRPDRMAQVLQCWDSRLDSSAHASEVAAWLTRYCFAPDGGLFTGGAASAMLFNIYVATLIDEPLKPVLARLGLTYTRYMDDLTFSSRTQRIGQRSRRRIREIIWAAGMSCNDGKTKVGGDLTKTPITIAGVMITTDKRIIPTPESRSRAYAAVWGAARCKVNPAVAHGLVGACVSATYLGTRSPESFMRHLRNRQRSIPTR